MTPDATVDVLIAGAGIAGTAAALELAGQGVRFLGIDAAPGFGGTARRGGVGISVAGSAFQREQGITDDPAHALRDLAAEGNTPDPQWSRFYYRRAARDVHDWYRDLGAEFESVRFQEGDTIARWHRPLGGGSRVMALAWARMQQMGVADCWRFGLRVRDIELDGDRVTGVVVADASGALSTIRARAVILATGGFGGNAELARRVTPRLADVPVLLSGGNADAQGELHLIAERAGLATRGMENVYSYANGLPDYRDPARGVVVRGLRDAIWINAHGARFHDEDLHIAGRSALDHLLEQPGQTSWVLFNDAAMPQLQIFDHYIEPLSETLTEMSARHMQHSAHVWSGEDQAAVARDAGVDAGGLARTVADWRALIASGAATDPLTGRKLAGLGDFAAQGRWYLIQMFPITRKTLGGIATDMRTRVRRADGRAMRNLFAAGELAGMGGGNLAGWRPLEGLMAGGSVFSGRIAGRWAGRLLNRSHAAEHAETEGTAA